MSSHLVVVPIRPFDVKVVKNKDYNPGVKYPVLAILTEPGNSIYFLVPTKLSIARWVESVNCIVCQEGEGVLR